MPPERELYDVIITHKPYAFKKISGKGWYPLRNLLRYNTMLLNIKNERWVKYA
ncbi:hypothetical protein Cst_c22260 [Thermoclostridium stercorarium subsp. stercorarium DSM 8532]|uniref:Uncharacterized protein n=1 Tax=Thermoclostridium stercorarium (strain ATCC 35414 / DSM 8532 / NCIMB 11754) TaxID=1121335 RepID=L7VS59_THES1|nr:hypothetical protein Cst_c22260 [Thermoclostridium stercorarium subsp. stercorarium DSM 8532]